MGSIGNEVELWVSLVAQKTLWGAGRDAMETLGTGRLEETLRAQL